MMWSIIIIQLATQSDRVKISESEQPVFLPTTRGDPALGLVFMQKNLILILLVLSHKPRDLE